MKKFFMMLNLIKPILDVEKLGDALLDSLEDYVARTDNKTDDALVLPVIKGLRIALDIEDDDEKKIEVVK
jgi:hypothetical protein